MDSRCIKCGRNCRKYGFVQRVVKHGGGQKEVIRVQRWQCLSCGYVFRELPDDILRFKQYSKTVIEGVKSGDIDESILEYEDYPCEMTMKRWRTQN